MTLEKTKARVAAGGSGAGSAFKEANPPPTTILSVNTHGQSIIHQTAAAGKKEKKEKRSVEELPDVMEWTSGAKGGRRRRRRKILRRGFEMAGPIRVKRRRRGKKRKSIEMKRRN